MTNTPLCDNGVDNRARVSLLLAGILALGVLLRMLTLPASFVWLDEANSILGASQGLPGLIHFMRTQENGPPLFQIILHCWIRLWGDRDVVCAMLPLIFSSLTPLLLFFLSRDLFGTRAGLWAVFLSSVNTVSIEEATNIRHNSLLELLTVLSFLFYFRMLKLRRAFWPYLLVCVLGIYTHYYFAFVIISQLLLSAIFFRKRLLLSCGSLCLVGIVFAPWIPFLLSQLGNGANSWLPVVSDLRVLGRFLYEAFIEDSGMFAQRDIPLIKHHGISFLLALPLFCIAFTTIVRGMRSPLEERKRVYALIVAYIASVWVPIVISMAKPIYAPHRYDIIGLPMIILFFSWVFSRVNTRSLTLLVASYYLINAMAFLLRDPAPHTYHDKENASRLASIMKPDDVLVFIGQGKLGTEYYLKHYGITIKDSFVFPLQVAEHPCWIDRDRLWMNAGKLGEEAHSIAEAVQHAAISRIFLFNPGQEWFPKALSKQMLQQMDSRFGHETTLPLNGFYYDEIRVYTVIPSS
ncbi:MAG: glycosyltransferase family 39 protein [Candidatus Aureabacteria bacterium]|nr:glycosyltransferase family 39 protein [Candidatus Auribacterota bacterium]